MGSRPTRTRFAVLGATAGVLVLLGATAVDRREQRSSRLSLDGSSSVVRPAHAIRPRMRVARFADGREPLRGSGLGPVPQR